MKPGYAYPIFLSLSGLASTTSDILQNQMIAMLFIGLLVVSAAVSLLGYRFSAVNRAILDSLPENLRSNFSPRPFAVSCLVMAALVGGFSTLSSKASANDGLIASAFPEIRELQRQLGIVQKDVAAINQRTTEIKKDTEFLKLAADQWLSVTDLVSSTQDGVHRNLRATFDNATAFLYKDIRIRIRGGANLDHSINGFILAPHVVDANDISFESTQHPEQLEICISALRGDGKRFKEVLHYGNPKDWSGSYEYRLVGTEGPSSISDDLQCEVEA